MAHDRFRLISINDVEIIVGALHTDAGVTGAGIEYIGWRGYKDACLHEVVGLGDGE